MLNSLPENPVLEDVFRSFPKGVRELLEYHDIAMRGPSPFSSAERELIAAYVSGLNACSYCYDAHSTFAEALGVETGVFTALLDNIGAAPVDDRLKPVLRYVRKLTLDPARVGPKETRAIHDAGWGDEAIHDAAMVCALYCFMNRLVEGTGVKPNPDLAEVSRKRREKAVGSETPYVDYGKAIGVIE